MNSKQLRNALVLARMGLVQIASQTEKYNAQTVAEVAADLVAVEAAGMFELGFAHLRARSHPDHVRLGDHRGELVAFDRLGDHFHGEAGLGEGLLRSGVDVLEQRDANAIAWERSAGHVVRRTLRPMQAVLKCFARRASSGRRCAEAAAHAGTP
ncbi:MAG: hypothetical protein ABIP94_17615 [Planctomycetota bacterium]